MKNHNESIRSFNISSLPGLEIIYGNHIINEFRRHIHNTYIIGMVTQGARIINHGKGSVKISKNEIFIIDPGRVHTCTSEGRLHSYKILSLSPETLRLISSDIAEKEEKNPCFESLHYPDNDLSSKMNELFKVIESPDSNIQLELEIYSFLSHLIIHCSKTPPLINSPGEQNDSIKRVCNFIRNNYKENLSLQKLAQKACLSQFHFQREFKKRLGITPHEYLSDYKIFKSREMLLSFENIADIAIQLGFTDQSHFSRIFRKTVGISPGRYIKLNRNSTQKQNLTDSK